MNCLRKPIEPACAIREGEIAADIGVGHARDNSQAVLQSAGVPPAIVNRFDERSRILFLRRIEEADKANQMIHSDDLRSGIPGGGRVAAGCVNHEATSGRLAGRELKSPFSALVLQTHRAASTPNRHATLFGLVRKKRIEPGAVEMPTWTVK